MDKRIEELEQRIKQLEEKLNQSSNMFGRSYSQVGSSDSDFLIKTRGQVKIQWGSKFIDLIKDGKLNTSYKFIYLQDEIGTRDGIYVSTSGEEVTFVVDGNQITLNKDSGNTYVSFLEEQQTSSDNKHQALINIGFLHPDLNSITSESLKSGIIYVESEHKLYVVQDGQLSEYTSTFPNPFTQQFIISKDDSKKGALVIKGSGINNSIAFDSMYIYTDSNESYIDSDNPIYIQVGGSSKVEVTESYIKLLTNTISNMFQSSGADPYKGFRLYAFDGKSTLEVDNLIVRNKKDEQEFSLLQDFFILSNNIVSDVYLGDIIEESKENNEDELENYNTLTLELKYANLFQVGDVVIFYQSDIEDIKVGEQEIFEDENGELLETPIMQPIYQSTKVYNEIIATVIGKESNLLVVESETTFNNIPDVKGQFISLLAPANQQLKPIRISQNNIDIIDYKDNEKIRTRIGNISDYLEKFHNKDLEILNENHGIYSELAFFNIIKTNNNLDVEDSSFNIPNTSWVKKITNSIIPTGTITLFNGEEVPDGWIICDGSDNTPDISLLPLIPEGSPAVYIMRIQ